ncbi:MAG: glycosyltransferase family 4 protein [Proteobacteria bacterium]|nr:glycosyltransferase family 4 protein [Pseudomonadota bacterium]
MKLLHLFAGPFPTVQGTQALIRQTCGLLQGAGHEVHLACYAHPAGNADTPFETHRIPDWPVFKSERSGPCGRKLLLDLSLARTVSRLIKELKPDLLHAHHYEALVAAKLADPTGRLPLVFHMHALFEPELPTYLPDFLGYPAGWAGRVIDDVLPCLADGIAAVDISIVEHLKTIGFKDDNVALVRPPAIPPSTSIRCTTGRQQEKTKAVYIGNLDPYQGLDNLLTGLEKLDAHLKTRLTVDIVTASDPSELLNDIKDRKLDDLVRVVPHNSPAEAWEHLLAADFTVIPRTLRGGAPIKLINALGAGRPTLVDNAFGKELQNGRETYPVDMKNPSNVAEAIKRLIDDAKLRKTLSHGALQAADRLFDPQKSLTALEQLYEKVL